MEDCLWYNYCPVGVYVTMTEITWKRPQGVFVRFHWLYSFSFVPESSTWTHWKGIKPLTFGVCLYISIIACPAYITPNVYFLEEVGKVHYNHTSYDTYMTMQGNLKLSHGFTFVSISWTQLTYVEPQWVYLQNKTHHKLAHKPQHYTYSHYIQFEYSWVCLVFSHM